MDMQFVDNDPSVNRGWPDLDPELTVIGHTTTKEIKISVAPDLIIISPMTRTIETAMNAFPALIGHSQVLVDVQIWPELREIQNAPYNIGRSRKEMMEKFPQFDFSKCREEWDHPPHSVEDALSRAEVVRKRLKELSSKYPSIAVVTHRCFITFLVKGEKFLNCGMSKTMNRFILNRLIVSGTRTYRFAQGDELENERMGHNCDSRELQDYGPTLLVPYLNLGDQQEDR
jgi:broad specificity phosphatase PhoE